jgi:hypothetical protein
MRFVWLLGLLGLLLLCCVVLSVNGSAAITVTLPISEPTNITTSLVLGGSLEASTTYYYVMIAYEQEWISPRTGVPVYHSPISEEGTFTTNTTHKSVQFYWNNSIEHDAVRTRYEILISKTSGDYTDSNSVGTKLGTERLGTSPRTGVTGFLVTELMTGGTQNYVIHSCQLVNDFVFGIDKDLGIIKVHLDGAIHTLEQIASALDTAGYSSYYYDDGYNFVLKGYITAEGTGSGSLSVEKRNMVFLKGGLYVNNPNYFFRFGRWTSDVSGANYYYGCTIDFQNSRYPVRATYEGGIRIYGSFITEGNSRLTSETEIMTNQYYTGGFQLYMAYKVDEFKDSVFGVRFRGYTSKMKDIKAGFGNNFGSLPHYRVTIWQTANMPYTSAGMFYDSDFVHNRHLQRYARAAAFYDHHTFFYNCRFHASAYTDSNGIPNDLRYSLPSVAGETVPSSFNFLWEMDITIQDDTGAPVSGVNLSLSNSSNLGVWVEYDTGSFDKDVTGVSYTGNVTTDVNGRVRYYVMSMKATLDPAYNPAGTAYTNLYTLYDYYFPYYLTISKSGYQTQTVVINNFGSPFTSVMVLSNGSGSGGFRGYVVEYNDLSSVVLPVWFFLSVIGFIIYDRRKK